MQQKWVEPQLSSLSPDRQLPPTGFGRLLSVSIRTYCLPIMPSDCVPTSPVLIVVGRGR